MAMRSQTQRLLLFAFIASILACGAIGAYVVTLDRMGPTAECVLGTTAACAGASILAMICAIGIESRRWFPVGWMGLASVLLALVLIEIAIWFDPPGRADLFWAALTIACTLAVFFPHMCLLSLARLHRRFGWIRVATIGLAGAVGLQIIVTFILDELDMLPYDVSDFVDEDVWFRGMGVMSIFCVCGTIAVPILHRLSVIPTRPPERTVDTSQRVQISCPRCGREQQLSLGLSQCAQCRLRIRIDIEEEHCPKCGYLTYRLESPVCPECGTALLGLEANAAGRGAH